MITDPQDLQKCSTAELAASACAVRDHVYGNTLTFSPKVFLPITNLCRNRCDYCSFRRSSGDPGEWTMTPDQVIATLDDAAANGCIEALFCLGDTPEGPYPAYRELLAKWGFETTVDYLEWAGIQALERGLLPHTNAGILTRQQMARLRPVNVSLGLMLENISPRMCEPGMPHHKAPDKRPQVRLDMTREAGKLRIPFTSGLLLGIGETEAERIDTLVAIDELHRNGGHIQEVIIQNFRTRPDIAMASSPEPEVDAIVRTVSMARLLLPPEISVQAPPNLNPADAGLLIQAGINDFGGISPVTPDYINHLHPWPVLDQLESECRTAGFELRPRLPIYDRYLVQDDFLDQSLLPFVQQAQRAIEIGNFAWRQRAVA